ncbi:MAG: hypothetical protein QM767_29865 [Anaeromyxobacter sp.]
MEPELDQIKAAALKVFRTPQAVEGWLKLHSPRLGGTPQALIEAGQAARVLALLQEMPQHDGQVRVFGIPIFRR